MGGGALAVVNDHVRSAASEFPAKSLAPVGPPLTRAVYVFSYVSRAFGWSVATLVFGL